MAMKSSPPSSVERRVEICQDGFPCGPVHSMFTPWRMNVKHLFTLSPVFKTYITQVWLSFVDSQNYQLGSLHTECGFPFRLGILSIRQTVAQTVFSLPRNHRTLFHRPTHCLEELLFACKWGVQKANVLQLKTIGCINARVNLDKCLFYSYRRCL